MTPDSPTPATPTSDAEQPRRDMTMAEVLNTLPLGHAARREAIAFLTDQIAFSETQARLSRELLLAIEPPMVEAAPQMEPMVGAYRPPYAGVYGASLNGNGNGAQGIDPRLKARRDLDAAIALEKEQQRQRIEQEQLRKRPRPGESRHAFFMRRLIDLGMFESEADYAGMIGHAIEALSAVFASQGHSGSSSQITIGLFTQLFKEWERQ